MKDEHDLVPLGMVPDGTIVEGVLPTVNVAVTHFTPEAARAMVAVARARYVEPMRWLFWIFVLAFACVIGLVCLSSRFDPFVCAMAVVAIGGTTALLSPLLKSMLATDKDKK